MTTTLTGVFATAADASRARSRLIESGCSASDITLDPDDSTSGSSSSMTTSPSTGDHADRRGFFAKLFGWDDDEDTDDSTRRYDMATRQGHVVLAVRVSDESRVDRVVEQLEDCGAVDVDERMASWGSSDAMGAAGAPSSMGASESMGATGTMGAASLAGASEESTGMAASGGMDTPSGTGDRTLRAVAEQLVVGKRTVQRGRVRIHRSMIETPVEEQVSLREERVRVERMPVDRPATDADLQQGFAEQDIELTETAEEPVVTKVARVVEEVRVGTESNERVQTVRDTVRRSEIDVENAEDVPSSMGTAKTSARYAGPERRVGSGAVYAGFERRQQAI